MIKVQIKIYNTPGVLDPPSKTLEETLKDLEYEKVEKVKIFKLIEFEIDSSLKEAYNLGKDICNKVLVNPNIETYEIRVIDEY